MKLSIRESAVAPMARWLKQAKDTGVRDEQKLRQILKHEDYQVEFARYGDPGPPVCGIHFDVANLEVLGDKEAFLHVLAHEIHHVLFPQLISENMTPRQYFFLNFAFEGLAMHFCNNASTVGKASKYPGAAFGVDEDGWDFYKQQHEQLMQKVFSDAKKTEVMSIEQVGELISEYEQFTWTSLKTGETRTTMQYPTYYIGCYLWGSIDLVLGSRRLFAALQGENGFDKAWEAVSRQNR